MANFPPLSTHERSFVESNAFKQNVAGFLVDSVEAHQKKKRASGLKYLYHHLNVPVVCWVVCSNYLKCVHITHVPEMCLQTSAISKIV